MKVRDVIEKLNDIEKTRQLLGEAMTNEVNGKITIYCSLAEDIDEKLEALEELWGIRELK